MNVVLPMAGHGQRFKTVMPQIPKMLIHVDGKPMMYWALDSLKKSFSLEGMIFVCLEQHINEYDLDKYILAYERRARIQVVKNVPNGQAESVYAARSMLNLDDSLLIYNCDTYTDFNLNAEQLYAITRETADITGLISVFESDDPTLSYVSFEKNGFVSSITEKIRVSRYASTGLYYFTSTRIFIDTVKNIRNSLLTSKEMYVADIYNYLIGKGYTFTIHQANQCYPLGTPEQLAKFIKGIS